MARAIAGFVARRRSSGFESRASRPSSASSRHRTTSTTTTSSAWCGVIGPIPAPDEFPRYLPELYGEIQGLLDEGRKVLVHHEEMGDRTIGLLAGYLVWTGLVPEQPKAIFLLEHITSRQLGTGGRDLVTVAKRLAAGAPG